MQRETGLFNGACVPAFGAIMSDPPGTITSYMASMLAYVASNICVSDIQSIFMAVGSAVLLIARLYVDVPRAWHAFKNRRKHRG